MGGFLAALLEALLERLRSEGTLVGSARLSLDPQRAHRFGAVPDARFYPLWFAASATRAGARTLELVRTPDECLLRHDGEGGAEELAVAVEWARLLRPAAVEQKGSTLCVRGLPWSSPGEAGLLYRRARHGPFRLVLNGTSLPLPGERPALARRLLAPLPETLSLGPAAFTESRASPGKYGALLELGFGTDWILVDRGIAFPLGQGPVGAVIYLQSSRGAPWPDRLVLTPELQDGLREVHAHAAELRREVSARLARCLFR
ncbi:MAG: hypothetical protein HY319_03475 [Armatimonadetes bacterium]|nr:hypothetical protein [Armatimonadota bacterium]